MNYQQIQLAIAGYLHRDDMAEQIKTGIALANVRIGQALRHSSNLISTPFTLPSESTFLPGDFQEVKSAWHPAGNLSGTLQLVGLDQLASLEVSGASPAYFAIEPPIISVKPFTETEIQLVYWATPVMPVNDTDENRVMLELPQLYIYGALMESFFWSQDGDLTAYAKQQFIQEIANANAASQTAATGSNRAMRRYR
jgi:hypothetical protein